MKEMYDFLDNSNMSFIDKNEISIRLEELKEKILQHISIIETSTDDMIVIGKCNQIREELNGKK